MKRLFLSVAAFALLGGSAVAASATSKSAPTAAEAKAFVAKAEKDLSEISVYAAKAEWVYETDITVDTSDLTAKAGAEANRNGDQIR